MVCLIFLPLALVIGIAHAAETPAAAVSFEEPAGVLTLDQALSAALLGSPRLAVYSWEVRVAEALALQARLRPNPELEIEAEGLRFNDGPDSVTRSYAGGLSLDGVTLSPTWGAGRERAPGAGGFLDGAEITLSLSQRVELGGKRARRIALARAETDVARWDFEAVRADVLAETARRFAAVLAAQEKAALAGDLERIAYEVQRAVAAQVEAGQVSPLDLRRARVETELAAIDLASAQRETDARRAALAAMWGSAEARFERAAGALSPPPDLPPLAELAGRARANPDVARWQSELARREAALSLARSQRAPDLTVMAGLEWGKTTDEQARAVSLGSSGLEFVRERADYDRDSDVTFTVGVSVPLPLFDRNQGNILAETHRLEQTAAREREARTDAAAGITMTYAETAARRDEYVRLRDVVLPELEDTRRLTIEGYQEGKFDYLNVLAIERDLFESRARALDTLAACQETFITLERLSGGAPGARSDTAEPPTGPKEEDNDAK